MMDCDQRLKGRLRAGELEGEGTGAKNEAAELGVGGGERGKRLRGVVARRARCWSGRRGMVWMRVPQMGGRLYDSM